MDHLEKSKRSQNDPPISDRESNDVSNDRDDIQLRPRGTGTRAIQVCATAALGGYLYGFSVNSMSGTLAQTSFKNLFLTTSNASSLMDGLLACFMGGAFIGAVVQAPVSNKWGRRKANLAAALVSTVAGVLQSSSYRIEMLLVGRVICGIGGGMVIANSPVYMSEVAPPHTRGLLVGFQGIAIGCAYATSSVCALIFSFVKSPVQWRLIYIVQTAIAVVFALSIIFLPESPRWLMEKSKEEQAIKELERLHRTQSDANGALVRAEAIQIKSQVEAERHLPKGYISIFKTRPLRKRALCSILLWVMGQGTGITAIANLFPVLMGRLGFDDTLQLGLACAWTGVVIFGCVVNVSLIDRIGRVRLLGETSIKIPEFSSTNKLDRVIGGVINAAALAIMTGLMKYYLSSTYHPGINAIVAFYFIFAFAFASMIDCTSYAYGSEIWPTYLRSEGSTIIFASFFANSLAYNAPINQALDNIGWKYYLVFVTVTVVSTALIAVYFPETKNLTLEEISAKFGDDVAVNFKDAMAAELQERPSNGNKM
ncbi:general substrate transporter [Annulohypoxylon maeteangense]|uniref:general substrate transporter n=1 Tax=Annulohypoxylon maeteangense TaxID=1927788 RepID=UPI0020072408|nr:general substrate transporter [Annulohypoxylon maeteangense]KAI0884104.1 general substrate transporter [Annulohypoxylon maeteangense]